MAKIDDNTIRRVKDAADIVDVVSDFVDLKRKGPRYLGLCPFHEDRHLGSFVVHPRSNTFRCFACDAKGGPVEFIMKHENLSFLDAIRYLGRKYNIDTDMEAFNYTPPAPRQKPAPLPMLTLPLKMVFSREHREDDILCQWIRKGINWDGAQRRRIEDVLKDYHVGHARQGLTIFWQIDEQMRVRTGKMMRYRPDGHRDRQSPYGFDWIHSALFRHKDTTGYDEDKYEMKQTLFGMHLLKAYPRSDVHIVESEKTALLMAIAWGNNRTQVWMACGGLENLSKEKLSPIMADRRYIFLYPDRDGVSKWQAKAENLHYDKVTVFTDPVLKWWREEDGDKADVADVVVRILNSHPGTGSIADSPAIRTLIDKLNLEPIDNDR